ncbi:hypothetical protein D6851_02045 [Altericroceibacterium spongiae]|uniref:Uncharacterized protein n=1 Tax=Altericroceibacterium spongiae TaxID=2320269 RepID=A0A420ERI6_9SPHN|nr:hypothetical protein [Altericroceibacterium spongiae]RKF23281.1 hypothetical protein D6851_02045 [Altericroceibacterium spongiae]
MRIALISLLHHTDDDPSALRGSLSLAGRSVALRQLEFALALGCERILCLAPEQDVSLHILQKTAEKRGARFRVVASARACIGAAHAEDSVLALADGLLPEALEPFDLLEEGTGILTLNAEKGVPAGFERIDGEKAWAGAMMLPGSLLERLAELPEDVDPQPALLRIGLQAGIRERSISDDLVADGRWLMLQKRIDLEALEPLWLSRSVPDSRNFAPTGHAVSWILRRWGTSLAERKDSLRIFAGAIVFALALALVCAWFGLSALAFIILIVPGFLISMHQGIKVIQKDGFNIVEPGNLLESSLYFGIDLALIWVSALAIQDDWAGRLFPPVMLMGLAFLAVQPARRTVWIDIVTDRAVLAGLLAIASFWSQTGAVIMLLALILLLFCLWRAWETKR